MPERPTPSPDIYPVLRYRDGQAAIDWLVRVLGFDSRLAVPGPDGAVVHAELVHGRGMVMLAGGGPADPANPWSSAQGGVYVAVDDVDAHHARARAAGADIVMALADTPHGSREYTARDPEGRLWCFGTYRP